MLENLSREQFAKYLNTDFKICFNDGTAANAKLTEVTESHVKPRMESFSLVFLAPPDAPVFQDQLKVQHPSMGDFELFMVPMGKNEAGVAYEAVFNRLTD